MKTFDQMVDEAVERKLIKLAEDAADRVVSKFLVPVPPKTKKTIPNRAPVNPLLELANPKRKSVSVRKRGDGQPCEIDKLYGFYHTLLTPGPAPRVELERLADKQKITHPASISSLTSQFIKAGFLRVAS